MLDEIEAPEDQDTPNDEVTETPNADANADAEDTPGNTSQGDIDWEKRYRDLQSDHTRKSQRLAEFEKLYGSQDPDDDDAQDTFDDDEFEDPAEERLARIEQYLAYEAEQRQRAAFTDREQAYIASEIQLVAKAMDEEFSEKESDAINRLAQTMRDERGVPDVPGAAKILFEDVIKTRRKAWTDFKKNSGSRPGQGGVVIDKFDPTDRKARINALAQGAEAMQAAQ